MPASARLRQSSTSVSTSSALDRSSSTTSSGACTRARAVASRWRCPPDSRRPRGPMSVAEPSGIPAMSSVIAASRSARRKRLVGHRPETDVVGDRVGDQLRHLREERRIRRHEERGPVVDDLTVPSHLARRFGVRRADRRAPAATCSCPTPTGPVTTTKSPRRIEKETSRIPLPPSCTRGQADHVEPFERHAFGALDGRPLADVTRSDREVPIGGGVRRVLVGHELAHPIERHAGLLAASQHATDHPGQERQPTQVGGEQSEVAERRTHRRRWRSR